MGRGGGRGSLGKSLWARPEETAHAHLCAWTHPSPPAARFPWELVSEREIFTQEGPWGLLRLTPCGKMKEARQGRGRSWAGMQL